MKKNIKTIITAALFALAIGAMFVFYNFAGAEINVGTNGDLTNAPQAADFTVYDASGNSIQLSSFDGAPIVVNFWASWCGPCKSELPHFQSMYEKYGKNIKFLMVNLTGGGNDSKVASDKILASGGYTFPVFYDDRSNAASVYSVRSMPVTCFISSDGKIAARNTGSMSAAKLEKFIGYIYGG